MAALRIEENADRFAYKKGLFVIRVTGENIINIVDDLKFDPIDFGK